MTQRPARRVFSYIFVLIYDAWNPQNISSRRWPWDISSFRIKVNISVTFVGIRAHKYVLELDATNRIFAKHKQRNYPYARYASRRIRVSARSVGTEQSRSFRRRVFFSSRLRFFAVALRLSIIRRIIIIFIYYTYTLVERFNSIIVHKWARSTPFLLRRFGHKITKQTKKSTDWYIIWPSPDVNQPT